MNNGGHLDVLDEAPTTFYIPVEVRIVVLGTPDPDNGPGPGIKEGTGGTEGGIQAGIKAG